MPPKLLENILKYGLLIATYPIWWPILKTLWGELQVALWREGGLIGRPPTPEEVPQLEKKYRNELSPFLSETYAEVQRREKLEDDERIEAKRRGPQRKGQAAPEPSATIRPAARRAASVRRGPSRPAAGGGTGGGARGGGLRRKPGGAGFGGAGGGSRRGF